MQHVPPALPRVVTMCETVVSPYTAWDPRGLHLHPCWRCSNVLALHGVPQTWGWPERATC